MLTLLLITAIVQNVGEQTFRAMKVSQGSQELLTSFPLSLTGSLSKPRQLKEARSKIESTSHQYPAVGEILGG